MTKSVFIILALFAVSSVWCDSSEEVINKVESKYLRQYLSSNKEHIEEGVEKLEKHCPGVGDKLKQALLSFHECDKKTDDSLTICQAIQTYALNCTKPLLKVVDDCLPAKAKGLPTLGVKSILSVADFLCKQTGESIFELANPCVWEDDDDESNEQEDECEKKVKDIAKKYEDKDTIPDKNELCTSLTGLRGCLQTSSTACKNPKTKTVVLGLFDAIVAPCSHLNEI